MLRENSYPQLPPFTPAAPGDQQYVTFSLKASLP